MNKEERNKIYEEVQKSVKDKYNVDISLQEINNIVNAQYKIAVYGFTKGFAIALPYLGTFVPVDLDHYVEHLIEPNKKKQKQLIAEGKEQEAKESMIESIAVYKKLVKEKKEGTTSAGTVIQSPSIGEIPDIVDIFKTFK